MLLCFSLTCGEIAFLFCYLYYLLFLQVNAETEDNVTPLLSAVAAGSLACLELLVQVSPLVPKHIE